MKNIKKILNMFLTFLLVVGVFSSSPTILAAKDIANENNLVVLSENVVGELFFEETLIEVIDGVEFTVVQKFYYVFSTTKNGTKIWATKELSSLHTGNSFPATTNVSKISGCSSFYGAIPKSGGVQGVWETGYWQNYAGYIGFSGYLC